MRDIVFNQSYYGYGAKTHAAGARLLRFLTLAIGSVASWLALLTSGEFGFERDTLEKSTGSDKFSVPDFDTLTKDELDRTDGLFDHLCAVNDEEAWTKVDAWLASLYGLHPRDLQVIDDTLRFNLPFAASRAAARDRPKEQQVTKFRKVLELSFSDGSTERRRCRIPRPEINGFGLAWAASSG